MSNLGSFTPLGKVWHKHIPVFCRYETLSCVQLENGKKLYIGGGGGLTLKIIAIRQNRIPCCTPTRDQKTEVISTALQKLDNIFVEINCYTMYINLHVVTTTVVRSINHIHLEDPWYVLYFSTKYLEPSFKKKYW